MADVADHQSNIRDFILARELAEVYLLLDNIATTQSKTLPTEIADPAFTDKTQWLKDICDIVWPPGTDEAAVESANAAKLLRAKDALNGAAAPATGASIAFTVLMTDEGKFPLFDSDWWRGVWRSWRGGGAGGDGGDGSPGSGKASGGGLPPTRISLAAQAYPSFARKAWRYRIYTSLLILILGLWLILTCLLSWDVATGSALLNRVNALDAQLATPPPQTSQGPTKTEGDSKETQSPSTDNATDAPKSDDATRHTSAQRDQAAENLEAWMLDNLPIRRNLTRQMGGDHEFAFSDMANFKNKQPDAKPPPVTDDPVNVEWAAIFIGVLAGTILPIFYGLLGAGTAVVRTVSDRMRDSTLMPRHIRLSFMQLLLGAVIGACVGLFASTAGSTAPAQGGLLGAVHLSTSALCFVAGFGVDGVFQALESLVRRVFNLDTAKSAAN